MYEKIAPSKAGIKQQIGPKLFDKQIVFAIECKGLIKPSPTGFTPTMAGELAIARMKGVAR